MWIVIPAMIFSTLATDGLTGHSTGGEQGAKAGEPKMSWVILRYRGDADESGPPVLWYATAEARRAGLAELKRKQCERDALLKGDRMETLVATIRKAHSALPAADPSDRPALRPYRFILGRDRREEVLDFPSQSARILIRSLVADHLESRAREVLVDFADEHQLLEGPPGR